MLTVILLRPLRMLFTKAVVGFSCLYLALAYAILCISIQFLALRSFQKLKIPRPILRSLPPHLPKHLQHDPRSLGLTFLPIGLGACIACALFLVLLQRFEARSDPLAAIEEYRRLPLACLGGPCIVLSLSWLGWTSSSKIHWIAPTLAGIPFGVGYLLIFLALLNHLTDAYGIFSVSAMAVSTCSRYLGGALLPFAVGPMYGRLGVAWASSLLGFLSLGMWVILFVFIRFGDSIRKRSKFCQELAERKRREKGERKAEKSVQVERG